MAIGVWYCESIAFESSCIRSSAHRPNEERARRAHGLGFGWVRYGIAGVFALLVMSLALSTPVYAATSKPKVDFNGDGLADVFLHEIFSGQVSARLIGGSGVLQDVSYGTVAPQTGWAPIGLSDFNGDGRTDILWRNAQTGELYIWLINGAHVLQAASLGTVNPSSGWAPIAIRDANGDGRTDILWRNAFSGEIYIWLMNGSQILQQVSLGIVPPDSGWVPADFGDFNGDGRTDVFWINIFGPNAGQLAVWLTDGTKILQTAVVGTEPLNSAWAPIVIKDFNGDGRDDILWRNGQTGELYIWLMNGTEALQQASLGIVSPQSGWAPIDFGDFNGDGRTDILWRNGQTGELYVWLMNGTQALQQASLGTVDPKTGWTPIGLDDYNGDGRDDILWRNTLSGSDETAAWLMNGSSFQFQSYGKVQPSSVWQIQIPR